MGRQQWEDSLKPLPQPLHKTRNICRSLRDQIWPAEVSIRVCSEREWRLQAAHHLYRSQLTLRASQSRQVPTPCTSCPGSGFGAPKTALATSIMPPPPSARRRNKLPRCVPRLRKKEERQGISLLDADRRRLRGRGRQNRGFPPPQAAIGQRPDAELQQMKPGGSVPPHRGCPFSWDTRRTFPDGKAW